MSPERRRNLAASVRQRLLNRARERGEDFNYLLTRYANERLLFRLAESGHRDQLVLKGATLFELWHEAVHRATRDVDLLGFGEPSVERMQAVFRELCTVDVEPDGLRFLERSVPAEPIRDGQAYGGVRVRLGADLDGARIALQVDIGFGDVVTPGVVEAEFPTLLDFPAPRLRTYPAGDGRGREVRGGRAPGHREHADEGLLRSLGGGDDVRIRRRVAGGCGRQTPGIGSLCNQGSRPRQKRLEEV